MLMRGARLNAIQLAATIVDVEVNVEPPRYLTDRGANFSMV